MLRQQLRDGVFFTRQGDLRRRPMINIPRVRIGATFQQNLYDVEVTHRRGRMQGCSMIAPPAVHAFRELLREVFHDAWEPAQHRVVDRWGGWFLWAFRGHGFPCGVVDVVKPYPGCEGDFLGEETFDSETDVLPFRYVAVLRVQKPVFGRVVGHREDLDGIPVERRVEVVVEMKE